ncbi:hypothetical protein PR002_g11373 [Phytophthora rubi]|uniref:Uncharacterized protein n=1 Tax=Phytophthora rubi TaxID=129364 RepID=A0A6A3LY68_9STRA|nr:hypothetical protein PR002_g11373 [Phytophthora rubi]
MCFQAYAQEVGARAVLTGCLVCSETSNPECNDVVVECGTWNAGSTYTWLRSTRSTDVGVELLRLHQDCPMEKRQRDTSDYDGSRR